MARMCSKVIIRISIIIVRIVNNLIQNSLLKINNKICNKNKIKHNYIYKKNKKRLIARKKA